MLTVGEHYLGSLEDREIRMSSGFAGGVGCTYQENCGVFSAGVIILGALHGRTSPDQDDRICQDSSARLRTQFIERFETVNCGKLREFRYGSGGLEPCSVLVERAARVLIQVIEEAREQNRNSQGVKN